MSQAFRASGVNLYVSYKGTAVSTDYREFTVDTSIDIIDKSAGSETTKSYLTALKDGTAKLTYAYSGTAGTAYSKLMVLGAEGSLLWGAEGTATNSPKWGANAIVTSVSKPHTYNDLITRVVSFQFSGTVGAFDGDAGDVW